MKKQEEEYETGKYAAFDISRIIGDNYAGIWSN
jgi:hypothetical protein